MGYDTFRNITLQHLELMIALTEAGSFTRAAARLYLSQPTLTKQMQNLEEAAGAKLINRGRTGVSLTPEGRILYDYASRILRLREEAKDRIGRLKNDEAGHIYLCASTIPATYLLPRFLRNLREACPEISVHVRMQDSEQTLQEVLQGHAEMGVIGKEPLNRRLVVLPLWEDHLVVAALPDHPLTKMATFSAEELSRWPFIVRERGSGTRNLIETCLQEKAGIPLSRFPVACELGSSEAVKEAILAGCGISILSAHAIVRELAQGLLTVLNLAECPMRRSFYLIYRKQTPLLGHHRRFLEMIRVHSPLASDTPSDQ